MSTTFKFGNKNWAWKEGSVLAYNSENNNFKPLPFDFTRSSSATRVNSNGLIEVVGSDEPRVDYLNNADGHLLLEPSRTNLSPQSEELDGVYWNAGTSSVTADSEISPDGSQNADTLTISSATGGLYSDDISVSASTTYTFSFYAKRGTIASDETALAVRDQSNATFISTDVTYSATTDSWTRVEHTFTTPVGCTSVRVYPQRLSGLGQGTIHLWGVQLEAGSYATSYIPTSGSSVTRATDISNATLNSSVLSNIEGTVFIDVDYTSTGNVVILASPHDGAANKRIEIWANGSTINGFIGGSSNIAIGSTTISNGRHKIAVAYKSGDSAFYIDGVQIGVSSTSFTIAALTKFSFNAFSGVYVALEQIKDAKLYNTRLTNAELAALTTL